MMLALYVDFLSLPISVGIADAPPWGVSAPDLAWVRGHGYRQGENGAPPPHGPALVEARAKSSG